MTRTLKRIAHRQGCGSATVSTNCCAASETAPHPTTHVVQAGHGHAFEVKRGHRFRIVDLHGLQVVDFAAWVLPDMKEKLSMSYTRFHLSGVTPMVGECLITNKNEPIFRLIEDTVKVHDMTFMSCNPELYERLGKKGHRSCATNIAEVMEPYGMKSHLEVTDPFNIFQNTPKYSLKALGSSRPGDYVEFEALKDAVCAVSCCPYDLVGSLVAFLGRDLRTNYEENGFNGGLVTDIAVVTNICTATAAI
jgi:uncharacterized protein